MYLDRIFIYNKMRCLILIKRLYKKSICFAINEGSILSFRSVRLAAVVSWKSYVKFL